MEHFGEARRAYPGDGGAGGPDRPVRIGIASWNTRDLLDECLAALPAAADGLTYEVVVVDNASDDGSALAVGRHSGVHLLRNTTNLGYAKAMNRALTHVTGGGPPSVLIALNPDTKPGPLTLTSLVASLMREPSTGLVAPRLVTPDGRIQPSAYRFPSIRLALVVGLSPARWQSRKGWSRWWLESAEPADAPADVDWAIGAVHVMRAEATEGCSPYSERWFMYCEDLDLCWNMEARGWRRRYEPSVEIEHIGNASGSQAWGEDRQGRILEASYDWYRLRRGRAAAWVWFLANLTGVVVHGAGEAWSARSRRTSAAALRATGLRARRHIEAFRTSSPGPASEAEVAASVEELPSGPWK